MLNVLKQHKGLALVGNRFTDVPLLYSCSHPFQFPLTAMSSKPTFRVHIPSRTQENVLSPLPPTTTTFALPGSAAEDLLRQAPAPKPQVVYKITKSRLSAWNLDIPNTGEMYNKISTTSFVPCFPSEMELDIASNAVD